MSDSYLSIDDWLKESCDPDDAFLLVLGAFRERLLRHEVELTGWRCTWNEYGRLLHTDQLRQPVPALAILDLKFDYLPHNWDIVLIPHNRWFWERKNELDAYAESSIITFLDKSGNPLNGPIDGWGKLYLSLKNLEVNTRQNTPLMPTAFPEPVALEDKDGREALYSPEELGQSDPLSTSIGREPIYRTGLVGKPTSWHLIEVECRRRWQAGERHPGRLFENRAEWARTLLREHPTAPVPTDKTVTNRLASLLRELAENDRPNS
jgi:hypothetical protein